MAPWVKVLMVLARILEFYTWYLQKKERLVPESYILTTTKTLCYVGTHTHTQTHLT